MLYFIFVSHGLWKSHVYNLFQFPFSILKCMRAWSWNTHAIVQGGWRQISFQAVCAPQRRHWTRKLGSSGRTALIHKCRASFLLDGIAAQEYTFLGSFGHFVCFLFHFYWKEWSIHGKPFLITSIITPILILAHLPLCILNRGCALYFENGCALSFPEGGNKMQPNIEKERKEQGSFSVLLRAVESRHQPRLRWPVCHGRGRLLSGSSQTRHLQGRVFEDRI